MTRLQSIVTVVDPAPTVVPNPWRDFPKQAPYVLAADAPHIHAFNSTLRHDDLHKIELGLPPEPWMGLHSAQLLVLLCNPGLDPGDFEASRHSVVASNWRANLTTTGGIPVLWLNDQLADTPGGRWWRRATKGLLELSLDYAEIAKRILAVEFHAYHSVKWWCPPVTLPSQPAGFALVEQAIDREATIVLSRAVRFWKVAVPRLVDYPRLVATRTVRSLSFGERNFTPRAYQLVREALFQ